MTDHFNGIAVFVEVAGAGSFTRAAERLGLTKSAVSKAITRLEERLGEILFTRSTRNLTLTVSGEAYLASCVSAIDILRDTEDALGGRGDAPRGRLRIDMPAAFGRRVLVPLLTEICEATPDLQLSLSFTDRVIDPIEEGVDLVVRFGRSRDAAGLMAKTLVEQPQHICASPAYLARYGTPATLDDLARHVCLVGFRRGVPGRWSVRIDGVGQQIDPPPVHQIGDGDAIIAMAIAGMGLCQMPSVLVREKIADGRLVPVLEELRGPDVPVQLIWPGTRQASPRVRYMIDRLVDLGHAGRLG
ncbi:LysR family transcriptional regulator [Sphingomonas sp. Leaf25]|nr:LysR family transcriptional regulator [Sphingomonas sp. Leaf25]